MTAACKFFQSCLGQVQLLGNLPLPEALPSSSLPDLGGVSSSGYNPCPKFVKLERDLRDGLFLLVLQVKDWRPRKWGESMSPAGLCPAQQVMAFLLNSLSLPTIGWAALQGSCSRCGPRTGSISRELVRWTDLSDPARAYGISLFFTGFPGNSLVLCFGRAGLTASARRGRSCVLSPGTVQAPSQQTESTPRSWCPSPVCWSLPWVVLSVHRVGNWSLQGQSRSWLVLPSISPVYTAFILLDLSPVMWHMLGRHLCFYFMALFLLIGVLLLLFFLVLVYYALAHQC